MTNISIQLNNPHKPRSRMSRRERFNAYEDECRYALLLIEDRWKEMSIDIQIQFELTTLPKLYVVATVPEKERKTLAYHFNGHLLNARLVVGRTSVFDSVEESKRRVCIFSTWSYGDSKKRDEMEDLLESFTVLIDSLTLITTPRGKHGSYMRWTQPKESDLTLVIKTITSRYGEKR